MKKLSIAMLALLMVVMGGLSVLAEAPEAGTYSITINDIVGTHTYEAYQIFSGDLYDGTLSNIVWGNGVTAQGQAALGDAAAKAATLETESDGIAFAKEVNDYLNTSHAISGTQTGTTAVINVDGPGYYLIKDADGSLDNQTNATYTPYILSVLGKVSVTPKSGTVPTLTKKVKDINDSVDTEWSDWQDVADLDQLDTATFQLTGTLPSDYDDYTSYEYIFHDIASVGLVFAPSSLKVYVDGTEITTGFQLVHNESAQSDGCTFELKFADLKTVAAVTADSVITVEYNALVSETYLFESENKVTLEYTNDTYNGQTGVTTPEYTYVYSYELQINKVDEEGVALSGAAFKVTKKDADQSSGSAWEDISSQIVVNSEGTVFTISGLDDGIYCIEETTTPDGYNTMNPMYFCVESEKGVVEGVPTLVSLQVYESDENGAKVTGKEDNYSVDADTGLITLQVVNQKGSNLPVTGGVGTTILYVVGGLLVVCSLVIFIAKKRCSN